MIVTAAEDVELGADGARASQLLLLLLAALTSSHLADGSETGLQHVT